MKYYPAFLDIKDKKAVVVGGGRVAERKVRLLLSAGASVTLISPDITQPLRRMAEKGILSHIKRNYRRGDLKDAFIVVAGTSSAEVNLRIAENAGHLVNVVDAPWAGNYIVPSIVKRGQLTIAISTDGSSPALSKTLRKELEKYYSREFASYLRLVEKVRSEALDKIKNEKQRERFLKSLASEDMLATLRTRGLHAAKKKVRDLLNKKVSAAKFPRRK